MSIMIPAWENGILRPLEKLSVHQRGLRHLAVSVFVLRGEEVLLQRRALSKYHTPGLWANTCCTHPAWGEPAPTCANRRLREELGITGLSLQPRGRVEYRADVGGDLVEHEVVDIFTAHVAGSLPMQLNPDEVEETKWMDRASLLAALSEKPDDFTPWLRIYMQQHSDTIFGESETIPA